MAVCVRIYPDRYCDSVSLMVVSQALQVMPGVTTAMVAMATPLNKELLAGAGLWDWALEAARPADLVLAAAAETAEAAEAALAEAERRLSRPAAAGTAEPTPGATEGAPRNWAAALRQRPDARLAFISVPGPFAAREARAALEAGLDVMLFSDNVPLEAEVALKRLASDRGLLLMGPDCGTAIIDGVGLGFANAVRRGPIGIVAASGTGAQELSTLIHRLGSGVSQIIGTGGRDLSPAVGGVTARMALERLAVDPATELIILISKPPHPEVAARVLEVARATGKPVVACFLGDPHSLPIDEAAARAVGLATGSAPAPILDLGPAVVIARERTVVVGLFSGGTLCDQARQILGSPGPVLLDLGDDRFTAGRPHPMIDPTFRRQHLEQAAADPATAVILLDIVLGHGAHPDPAGALAGAIAGATRQGVAVVASVTGVEGDPQGLPAQVRTLRRAGAVVAATARQAALAVAAAMEGRAKP